MPTSARFFQRSARRARLCSSFVRPSNLRTAPFPRTYATHLHSQQASTRSNTLLYGIIGGTLLSGLGYTAYWSQTGKQEIPASVKTATQHLPSAFTPTFADYQDVYNEIARRLIEHDDYDDGSYGPVVLRLGWHASGTYDAETGTGGSNGATMRFAPEMDHGANSGLKAARDFLEPVKGLFLS